MSYPYFPQRKDPRISRKKAIYQNSKENRKTPVIALQGPFQAFKRKSTICYIREFVSIPLLISQSDSAEPASGTVYLSTPFPEPVDWLHF